MRYHCLSGQDEGIQEVALVDTTREQTYSRPDSMWLRSEALAALFGVDPKTVTRWAKAGKFAKVRIFRTPGGHRRYNAADVYALIEASTTGGPR